MFQLDRWSFPTKKILYERLQDLLGRTPPETILTGEDKDLLIALARTHYHKEELIGPGIQGIIVGKNEFGYRGFEVLRVDGTRQPWSFKKAIYPPETGIGGWSISSIRSAFRAEVSDQTQAYKTKVIAQGKMCPISGHALSWDTTDIDHVLPFSDLLKDFLKQHGLTLNQVEVFQEPGNAGAHRLVDRNLADVWSAWHKEHAELRALWRDAHRSKEGQVIRPLQETRLTGSKKRVTVFDPDEDLSDLF